MNWQLKERIIQLYGTQADFAYDMKITDSLVSRVIRNRKELCDKEKECWAKALKCDKKEIFKQVKIL